MLVIAKFRAILGEINETLKIIGRNLVHAAGWTFAPSFSFCTLLGSVFLNVILVSPTPIRLAAIDYRAWSPV